MLAASHKHDDIQVINKPLAQKTHQVCVYQDRGINSGHKSASFQIDHTNPKEPYKIELDEKELQKPRVSFKPSTKAVAVQNELAHKVSDSSVEAPKELDSITGWSSENPLSVAQNLPTKVIQKKSSPLMN